MAKELSTTYNPADIEARLYDKWLNKKYFIKVKFFLQHFVLFIFENIDCF